MRAAAAPGRLLNRSFVLLWQGQAISQLGNQAFIVATMFWTMEATGSASLMGLLASALSLPAALLAPLGGALADRFRRVTLIVASDALSGLALLVPVAAMTFWDAPPAVVLPLLIGVSLLLGSFMAVINPAVAAVIPDLVPPRRLAAANSLNQLVIQVSIFLGQAVGGVLFRLLGAPLLLAVDAVSFLLASASESFIAAPATPRKPSGLGSAWQRFGRELTEGLAYVWKNAGLRSFVGMAAAFNFFAMPLLVLLPFYVRDYLGRQADWYGFLLAAVSVGAVAGYLLAGGLQLAGPARSRLLVGVLILAPLLIAAVGQVRDARLALALAFGLGLATGIININVITLVQATTPQQLRGRVMGLLTALTGGIAPLGMALGGVVGDLMDRDVPAVTLAAASAALVITLAAVARRSTREFLATELPAGGLP